MQDVENLSNGGERMVPGVSSEATFWDHIERYRFACLRVHGKDVVDLACGEGFGTASMLLAGARSVLGIDISSAAVGHAVSKYGVRAEVGNAETIPIAENSLDVFVSFETIEHVEHPERFFEEIVRVLKPTGQLLISTPNKPVYRTHTAHNAFHVSEMTFDEFNTMLKQHFQNVRVYAQQAPYPWYFRIPGLGRISWTALRYFSPESIAGASAKAIGDTPLLCATQRNWIHRMMSPAAVKLVSHRRTIQARYLVAEASHPIKK